MPRLNFFYNLIQLRIIEERNLLPRGKCNEKNMSPLTLRHLLLDFLQAGVRFMDQTADPALATGSSLLPNMASIFIQEISLENHSFLCLKSKSSCMC